MADRHVRDDLAAYALDILEPHEAARVESHLATCPDCLWELAELERGARELAWLAPEATPDPRLRAAILAGLPDQVRASRGAYQGRGRPRPIRSGAATLRRRPLLTVAAGLLLFALGFGSAAVLLRSPTTAAPGAEITAYFHPARVHVAALEPTEVAPQASARIYFDPARTDFIVAVDDLPPPPPGMVYQVWANRGGQRWSAGTLTGTEPVQRLTCPREMGAYDTVGVTLEPAGGQDQPSGPRVLLGSLPKTPGTDPPGGIQAPTGADDWAE